MAKVKRSMNQVAESQQTTETHHADKFEDVKAQAQGNKPRNAAPANIGRVSPQISCTVGPEDKEDLTVITLQLSQKHGRILNTSTVIRALIKLGKKRIDELEV